VDLATYLQESEGVALGSWLVFLGLGRLWRILKEPLRIMKIQGSCEYQLPDLNAQLCWKSQEKRCFHDWLLCLVKA